MDSFELNKIAGAVLAALLVWFGTKMVADGVYSHHAPEKPGYVVAVAKISDAQATGGKEKAGEQEIPIAKLLQTANADAGKKELKKCVACHSFDKGGKNKVGPKLWGVYEREIAGVDGFSYSKAMKAKGGKWTAEELSCFLKNPKKCIKGTKMVFKGYKNAQKRADLIKYLGTLK